MCSNLRGHTFHRFLGFHSFLIGLFPFFLPVYLVRQGASLAHISSFVALTGVGFCLCLAVWDRWLRPRPLILSLGLSFLVELLVLLCLVLDANVQHWWLLALLNGLYNGLFWTVQRLLFFTTSDATNTGRKFGNFQIYVTLVLKAGIFIGGVVLEQFGIAAILWLSVLTSVVAMGSLYPLRHVALTESLRQASVLTLSNVLRFHDPFGSRTIFAIDGVFLYLESYFWLISLFLLVEKSFWQLGLLVIAVAIGFTVVFYLVKNRIDRMVQQRVYRFGVGLYVLSWIFRSQIDGTMSLTTTYLVLILIAFCTTYFRLTLNKRFFDIAHRQDGYRYILQKSYLSQAFIGLTFAGGAFVLSSFDAYDVLPHVYLMAAVVSPVYLLYQTRCG